MSDRNVTPEDGERERIGVVKNYRTETPAPARKALISEFRTILLVLAVPATLTVWTRVSEAVDLNNLLELLTTHWRAITRVIWYDAFAFLRLPITPLQADAATFSLMVLGSQIAAIFERRGLPKNIAKGPVTQVVSFGSTTIILIAFFFPTVLALFSEVVSLSVFGLPVSWALACSVLMMLVAGFILVRWQSRKDGMTIAIAFLAFASFTVIMLAADMATGDAAQSIAMFVVIFASLFVALLVAYRLDDLAFTRILLVCVAVWLAGEITDLIEPVARYLQAAAKGA